MSCFWVFFTNIFIVNSFFLLRNRTFRMNEYYLVLKQMKLAITHDWLTVPGGAEKVVKRWYDMYPDAPVHTTVFDSIKNRSYF